MLRRIWSAAALTVGVALGGSAIAGDDAVKLGRFQPSANGFAGAVKSAAEIEPARGAADDTELVHGWHRHRRYGWGGYGYGGYGYRGGYGWPGYSRGFSSFSIGFGTGFYPGYGGFGWGGYGGPRYGYGWGGYGGGWPRYGYGHGWGGYGYGLGYSSFYRPGFSLSVYSAPRMYYPAYSYGYSSFDPWCDWSTIGGLASTVRTPATLLGNVTTASRSIPAPMPSISNGTAQQLPPPTPLGQRVPDVATPNGNSTFRYDGGPTAPVPMPDTVPAPKTIEPVQEQPTSIPISLPARKPAYKYPAYGDKK